LNQAEIKSFRDFLNSPSFNKNKQIVNLFELLIIYYPVFGGNELTEENLFSQIFINQKYDYFKMKNLSSDLLALGKEFLAFMNYKKNRDSIELYILRESKTRNLDLIFENTYKHADNRSLKTTVKDENYLYHRINLVNELIGFNAPKNPSINLSLMQDKLDLFVDYSIIMLLRFYNIMLHDAVQFNHKYDLKMFNIVMDYVRNNLKLDNPTMLVYYQIIQLGLEKSDENFFKLNKLRKKYRNDLSAVDNYMTFLHLDSYCANAYNEFSRTDLMYEQFLLTKECDINLFPELGKILYPDFLYSVKIAVRVDEFDYALQYIEKYKHNLTEEKKNTLDFCHAYIAYRKGRGDEALDLLAKTSFSNFIMKIQVRLFLLQLTFEKEYFDQSLTMIDSFRHYISRENLLLDKLKTTLLKFLKITGDLIKHNTGVNRNAKDAVHKIRFDIDKLDSNHFGIKLWLMEKVDELK
jgi:hypothetical protein